MLRSGAEIPDKCRECFGIEQLTTELALRQADFHKQDTIVTAQEAALGISGSWSEARQSQQGKQYTEIEEQVLDVLELATFCSGQGDDCFKKYADQIRY